MFGKIVATIISLLLLGGGLPKETVPQKSDGNWTCFQADCQHTGWMPQEALPDPAKIKLAWKEEGSSCGKPIIIGNKMYVGSGGIKCIDIRSGKTLWESEEWCGICRQLAWFDGDIFTDS